MGATTEKAMESPPLDLLMTIVPLAMVLNHHFLQLVAGARGVPGRSAAAKSPVT